VDVKNKTTGEVKTIKGDYFFSTMLVKDLIHSFENNVPVEVKEVANGLMYRDFITVGLLLKNLKIANKTTTPTINDIVADNWIILICYLLLIIRPLNEIISKDKLLFPFITVLIYAGGFTPVLVEERYLWVVYLLLLLMGAFLLTLLFKNDFFTPSRKTVLVTIFIISFLIMPVNHLVETINTDKDVYLLSESVNISPHTRIASNNEWLKSTYLAYYWNSEYIGQTKPTLSSTEQIRTLQSYETDYYIVWGNSNDTLLSNYTEVTNGQLKCLKIYDLKN